MKFKLINTTTVVTRTQCFALRVLAVTDEKDFKHCKMIEADTVKLQRRVSKGKFEAFATAKDLKSSCMVLDSYINTMTCGQPYARV